METYLTNNIPRELLSDPDIRVPTDAVSHLSLREGLRRLSQEVASNHIGNKTADRLSARLLLESVRCSTSTIFSEAMEHLWDNSFNGRHAPIVSDEFIGLVRMWASTLDATCTDFEHCDESLSRFSLASLAKSYLLGTHEHVIERPVFMYMRVALAVTRPSTEQELSENTLKLFKTLAQRKATFATPVMFNAGCRLDASLASCFLYAITDQKDSIEGYFDALKDCAKISKMSGGLGISLHGVQSAGTPTNANTGKAPGVLSVMKLLNTTARVVDQGGGKRRGSIAVYLEPHHPDIVDFLEARMTYGAPDRRTQDLFTALWVSDLFMKRAESRQEWSLLDPVKCPGLDETHGEEFEKLYESYEEQGLAEKTIRADELLMKIVDVQLNCSMPFVLFKDACNRLSNQKHLGTIRSSNLCTEIIEYSDNDETAVCNLASICLPKFIKNGEFDWEEYYSVCHQMAYHLDALIDISEYPIESAERSNKRHRPIGVGTQGLADCFMLQDFTWGSQEALQFDRRVHATLYHAAISASVQLAKENGPYSTFRGSPASHGYLQPQLWRLRNDELPPLPPNAKKNWEMLRAEVAVQGLRNSLSVALMPTASTAHIAGNSECIEPYTAMIYQRSVLAGTHTVVNPILRDRLMSRGKWNKNTVLSMIEAQGSAQPVSGLTDHERKVFSTAWEIKQRSIVDHAAARAPFVCQSMSLNIHMREPERKKMLALHLYTWKKGLKTGMYYLRQESPSSAIQFSVRGERPEEKPVQEAECLSCSA